MHPPFLDRATPESGDRPGFRRWSAYPSLRGPLIFGLVSFLAAPAWAGAVDIRCPALSESAKGELEARARLFLTSAEMEGASIGVECDGSGAASLVWTDGSRSPIDTKTNLVEGTLDAIEERIARTKRSAPPTAAPSGAGGTVAAPAIGGTAVIQPPSDGDDAGSSEQGSGSAAGSTAGSGRRSGIDLEGGVGLALLTEFWSGAYSAGVGPRLDVGVGVGRMFAIVISEGARFAVGSGSGQMMAFDVQAGLAYGAPYQVRTGLGVMALVGAERLAASRDVGGYGGIWTWSATGALGVRGSVAVGPVDAWVGVDGMLRSSTIETGGTESTRVPTLSAILSVGCFLPAFAGGSGEEERKSR